MNGIDSKKLGGGRPHSFQVVGQAAPSPAPAFLLFVQLWTLNSNICSTRKLRVVLTDIVINLQDWHLVWLFQLKTLY